MGKPNRRPGDRKDGVLLRDLDALHFITGVLYPNRCDNEAYISEQIDLTPIKSYLAVKNNGESEFPYTFFHIILTALMRTVYLRPKLNRFIVNGNFYQRREHSVAFIVKKHFDDKSEEALAYLRLKEDDTLTSIHEELRRQIYQCRAGESGSTDNSMNLFNKLPRHFSKTIIHFIMWLDRHGMVPQALIAEDPYYSSMVISNLGSIKLRSGYHHLTNWGTCSLFCIIGEKKLTPFYNENGNAEMRETLDLGLTVDERLADGYYYSKSIRLLRYLLEHPEKLEEPMIREVEYD